MRSYRLLALSVLTLTLVSGAGATTKEAPKQHPSTRLDAKTTTLIAETTVQVWNCQAKLILLGQRKTRDKFQSPWSLPKSAEYRTWVLKQRIKKQAACLKRLHADDEILRRLRIGLDGTPMAGSEGALVAAGRRWGVSPYFIAAIAGTESSFGAAACRNNRYNAFGFSSCGSGWRVPYFRSWGEAYDFAARFLTGRTTVTSGWPNARTTFDYFGYAACSSCWGAKTAMHMRQLFGVGNSVRF